MNWKLSIFILAVTIGQSLFAGNVNIAKSSFAWTGTKVTGKHEGFIHLKSASLTEKKGVLTGGSFVMDMDRISVTDLSGKWEKKFLTHIKSADFFDIKQFPTSQLEITQVKGTQVTANLTIKGKTHTVQFPFTKQDKKYEGVLTFDRTKFNMVYGSGNFFKNLGDKVIHDPVTVAFTVVLN